MKAYRLLTALLLIFSFGCSNDDNATNPSNNQSTLNAEEQQLLGNWVLDSVVITSNINGQQSQMTQNYNDPATCKLNLKASNSTHSGFKECDFALHGCQLMEFIWRVTTPGYIDFSTAKFKIENLSPNKLILKNGQWQYYLHK